MGNEISQDSKQLALLTWVGTIIFGFIPSLIVLLAKKDDEFVQDQAKEALNLAVLVMVAYAGVRIVSVVAGVFKVFFLVLFVGNLVLCIMAIVVVNQGGRYRLPFDFRLIR